MQVCPFVIPTYLQGKVGVKSIAGFDYNVWIKKEWGGKGLTAPEFTNILKYTLDQRMKGNRAPLLIGLHSDIYSTQKDGDFSGTKNARARPIGLG